MKNSIFVIFFLSIIIFFACKKETPVIKDPCDNAYDLRSETYKNLFYGELPFCPIENKYFYPDKYSYLTPIVNPNNEYEICYLKKDNNFKTFDLYKYNFCTNQATLIIKNIYRGLDWSVKDWILFGKDFGLWKIKSNGDSLEYVLKLYFKILPK